MLLATQLAQAHAHILINNCTYYTIPQHTDSQFFCITISFCHQIGPHSPFWCPVWEPIPKSKSNFCSWSKKLDMDRCTTTPSLCPCSQLILSCTFFWTFQFFIVHAIMQYYKDWRNSKTEEEKTHYETMFKKQKGKHYHVLRGEQKLKGKNTEREEFG